MTRTIRRNDNGQAHPRSSTTTVDDSAYVPENCLRRPGEEVIGEDVFDHGVGVYFLAPPATGFEFWGYDDLDWPEDGPEAGGAS